MRTTDTRKLNRLIRESFEDGYSNLGQTPIALLGIEDIIDLIMLTIAAMKSENLIPSVSERQKEKVKRRLYEAGNRRRYRILRK